MEFDIVIVGGGLVGASLAASLRHSGLSLALVESQCSPALPEDPELADPELTNWDSRIYAISPGSRRYLEEAGAWDHLATHRVAPVEEMRVFGDDDAKLEFSAYQMGVPELACILENRELLHALWQVLRHQDNLTLLQPARCASLNVGESAAELELQDGRSLKAKLVVGADGRDSWVRNQVGLGATPTDYRQHGVVANFTTERPHRGIAYQWFRPEGILALLPLPGNRVSMVWSVSPENSAGLTALTREELGDKVATAAKHTLGKMEVITPAAAFPLRLLVLPQIAAPRIALIGDAAHNMHPLAGQGVNTGFRDAQELARTLLERGGCADCGDAQLLRRYDRRRKEDIWSMQATTYGLKNLFTNDDPILRKLRNIGMDATNRLTPLKKLLVQHALN
jgi:ubiquinone biosynthesis UbiH/UbiF/VisC/COQ6 family hydroxylase